MKLGCNSELSYRIRYDKNVTGGEKSELRSEIWRHADAVKFRTIRDCKCCFFYIKRNVFYINRNVYIQVSQTKVIIFTL